MKNPRTMTQLIAAQIEAKLGENWRDHGRLDYTFDELQDLAAGIAQAEGNSHSVGQSAIVILEYAGAITFDLGKNKSQPVAYHYAPSTNLQHAANNELLREVERRMAQ